MMLLPTLTPPTLTPPSLTPSGILLYIFDSAAGGRLNMSAWARNRLEKKEKEEKEK